MANRSLKVLESLPDADEIREDLLTEVAEVIRSRQTIEFFSPQGIVSIHRGLNSITNSLHEEILAGRTWGNRERNEEDCERKS